MELFYRMLADLIVTVHFAYVAFVVVGLVLTLGGAVLHWRWVRNFWFRAVHLAMIGIVVAEAWCGIPCPLTTWENQLRQLAGEEARRGGFVANILHDAMFFEAEPWVFTLGYTLEELGRGGMGVVYKARQTSPERLVALKLIRDGALAAPLDRARFQIEAEASSRLQHPHVVQIFEVGQHAGHSYFAMEFAEGGSLDRCLAGRPQPARDAAVLIHVLALAIQHAHERKIVHRDLKPANILLFPKSELSTPPPTEVAGERRARVDLDLWVPKIADFGLAKRMDSQTTAFTQDGAVLGRPVTWRRNRRPATAAISVPRRTCTRSAQSFTNC